MDEGTRREYDTRYMRERREWLKAHHFCIRCKKQDAYTLAGRLLCADCTAKRHEYDRRYYAERIDKAEAHRARKKALTAERKENHLCIRCGKELSEGYPYSQCESCRARKNYQRELKERERGVMPRWMWGELGLCVRCGRERASGETWAGAMKLCERCYENSCKALEKARASYIQKHGKAWDGNRVCV